MSTLISYLRTFDYKICLQRSSVWTIDEAVDYVAAFQVNRGAWDDRESAYNEFVISRDHLLQEVLDGIDSGALMIHEEYQHDSGEVGSRINIKTTMVKPYCFIDWAIHAGIEVPPQFEEYAEARRKKKSKYYEAYGIKQSIIHHERSRAVAELLWSQEPDIPIAQMALRREIIIFGCEGKEYDSRTICRWLTNLKSVRKLGRPRKKSSVAVNAT